MGHCLCSCKDSNSNQDIIFSDYEDIINTEFFISSPLRPHPRIQSQSYSQSHSNITSFPNSKSSNRSYSENFYDRTILMSDEDMLLQKNSYNNDYLTYLKL